MIRNWLPRSVIALTAMLPVSFAGTANAQDKLDRSLREGKRQGKTQRVILKAKPGYEAWARQLLNQKKGGVHNGVDTREKLQAYDPELAVLIGSVFPNKSWRYERPDRRKEAAHLKGYDPSRAPRFIWPADLPPLQQGDP